MTDAPPPLPPEVMDKLRLLVRVGLEADSRADLKESKSIRKRPDPPFTGNRKTRRIQAAKSRTQKE